ncbi:MAG: helix-turn-helix transcriptional regulator [Nitrospinae bacterium]|nr:helix-turn-helix transcriptional regulator [Nitrospinota bacterium]
MKREKKRLHPGRPPSRPSHPLYRLFEERGIDKYSFAQAMGITRTYLDKILSGVKRPSAPLALRMAGFLGLSLEEVLFPGARGRKEGSTLQGDAEHSPQIPAQSGARA